MNHPAPGTPQARANPVLWLVIALPLLAVVAGLGSWALAVTRGDRELPSSYHWEGGALDRDDARRAAAAALGLRATLRVDEATQRCVVTLQGAAPAALRLDMTHPTNQAADRHVLLQGAAGVYSGQCEGVNAAHWWLQLADQQGSWLLRGRASSAPGSGPLAATLP
jgi:hypothetical protein